MNEEQEITVDLGERKASIKKPNDQGFSANFSDQETGINSLHDASHIFTETTISTSASSEATCGPVGRLARPTVPDDNY